MSRKVNPTALRVGVSQDWKSKWFAEGDRYADAAIEDSKIRDYLYKKLRTASLDSIIIERSIKSVKITIHSGRPGVVIGRKGTGLAEIREALNKLISKGVDIDIQVEEVARPDLSARIVAENVAMQIERRINARRAINIAADKVMTAGAKGAKIQVGGTIYGPNSIALSDTAARGAVPTQTLRADIDFAQAVAKTRGGTIGLQVWVYKGEVES